MSHSAFLKSIGIAGISALIGAAVAISLLKIDSLTQTSDPGLSRTTARYIHDPFSEKNP